MKNNLSPVKGLVVVAAMRCRSLALSLCPNTPLTPRNNLIQERFEAAPSMMTRLTLKPKA